ncbi:hypothetical protein B0H14DRAFT_3452345 [Mycena olivaceomarginata]|nr:hypothetical protein B0H14DRAFT_3452345 [Mycena olivaceomarginata]
MPSIFKPVDLPWTSLGQFYTAKVHTASRASPTRFLPLYPPTTCTPYRHVPQGIIDLHPTSLLACTLVCWVFVPTCRAARLRSPYFPMLPRVRLHSPHLATHVRDLTVDLLFAQDSPLPAAPESEKLQSVRVLALPALAAAILRLVAGGGLGRPHVLNLANVAALFLRSALSLQKVRKRKARGPTQSRLVDGGGARWTPEYLNLSLDSKVAKLLDAGSAQNFARGGGASAMRSATDYTATMGVDQRPVGLRARSAAGVLLFFPFVFFLIRRTAWLCFDTSRVALRFWRGFAVDSSSSGVRHGRSLASFCLCFSPRYRALSFLLPSSPLFLLGRGGSTAARASATSRRSYVRFEMETLAWPYCVVLSSFVAIGSRPLPLPLAVFGGRGGHANHIDPALYDHARLTRLCTMWIIMEAAPPTRPWFRRRTMRARTLLDARPGPRTDPFVPPSLPAREQPARGAGRDRVVRIWARGGPPLSPARPVSVRRGEEEEREDPSSPCSLPSPRAHPRRAGVLPTERGAGLCGVPKTAVGKDGDAFDHRGVHEKDADAAEADAEAEVEHQDGWRAELRARKLDELREEWERGHGDG